MKVNSYIALLFLLIIKSAYSQNSCNTKFLVRDIDNKPIYVNLAPDEEATDSLYYLRFNGERIKLNCDIHYWGGDNELKEFIDRVYYNRYDYNYQELDDKVNFCIIFDEYLHIQDIRITKRFHDVNDVVANYIMIYSILSKTENNWEVKDRAVKSWHIYMGNHFFY